MKKNRTAKGIISALLAAMLLVPSVAVWATTLSEGDTAPKAAVTEASEAESALSSSTVDELLPEAGSETVGEVPVTVPTPSPTAEAVKDTPKPDETVESSDSEAFVEESAAPEEKEPEEDSASSDASQNASAQKAPAKNVAAPNNGAMTITSEEQQEAYFLDDAFRGVVFDAVRDGQDGATGTDVLDALKNFYGEINAKNLGITDVSGLQYLRGAGFVDLSKNAITDWSILELEGKAAAPNDYYHYAGPDPEDRSAGNNVEWKIGGNPFTLLPENFGGNLVIDQPATTSSVYPEHFRPRVYLRGSEPHSQVFNITRCKVLAAGGSGERWVKIHNASTIQLNGPDILRLPQSSSADNVRLPFGDVKKSGIQVIAVGIDQEVHYWTNDEYNTLTPGSQSFKYYIHPQFFVYDQVTLSTEADFVLTKVDAVTGAALQGAVYSLFNADNQQLQQGLTTDSHGQLTLSGLEPGSYTLVETQAPGGYQKDTSPQAFTIGSVTLGGGKAALQTTVDVDEGPSNVTDALPYIADGQAFTAPAGTVYIAGPKNSPIGTDSSDSYYEAEGSPDISLSADTAVKTVSVLVTYDALDNGGTGVTRSFDTLQKAQEDINTEKNNNNILGSVTVEVAQKGANAVTATHRNTKLPTPTPSATPAPTPTATPAPTPTVTPTPTPSATPAPTPTVTPTPSPSVTPAPTPTVTPTPSPSATPAPTPTVTPTPSPSATPAPTPTVTPTPTPSATPAPTPTVTPTPTPSATPAPTPTVTPSPTATPGPTVSPSPKPTAGPTATPAPAPTGSPTVSPKPPAKTGDSAVPLLLFGGLFVISGGIIAFLIIRKMRNKR